MRKGERHVFFICPLCSETREFWSSFCQHAQSHFASNECDYCARIFIDRDSLLKHAVAVLKQRRIEKRKRDYHLLIVVAFASTKCKFKREAYKYFRREYVGVRF